MTKEQLFQGAKDVIKTKFPPITRTNNANSAKSVPAEIKSAQYLTRPILSKCIVKKVRRAIVEPI